MPDTVDNLEKCNPDTITHVSVNLKNYETEIMEICDPNKAPQSSILVPVSETRKTCPGVSSKNFKRSGLSRKKNYSKTSFDESVKEICSCRDKQCNTIAKSLEKSIKPKDPDCEELSCLALMFEIAEIFKALLELLKVRNDQLDRRKENEQSCSECQQFLDASSQPVEGDCETELLKGLENHRKQMEQLYEGFKKDLEKSLLKKTEFHTLQNEQNSTSLRLLESNDATEEQILAPRPQKNSSTISSVPNEMLESDIPSSTPLKSPGDTSKERRKTQLTDSGRKSLSYSSKNLRPSSLETTSASQNKNPNERRSSKNLLSVNSLNQNIKK